MLIFGDNLPVLKSMLGELKGKIRLIYIDGTGTTLVASEVLNRRWIGIDNSPIAIKTTIKRLLKIKHRKAFILYNATEKDLPQTLQEILQQKSA